MKMVLSDRMQAFQPSIFSELVAYKQQKIKQGCEIIDLSIGSPDLSPPQFVIDTLQQAASSHGSYRYTMAGTREFHEAVASYYETRLHAPVNSDKEICLLMGSQDGLVHIPMIVANPGDYILVPDPGYTAYATGIAMAGAIPYLMPLRQEHQFLPDFRSIPEEVAKKAKLLFLNCPGNPVSAFADEAFFKEAIAFASKYDIWIVHDFAYGELYFDQKKPISFLSVDGAKEVGIEINSLSKSFNLAGCRIGYVTGNEELIQAIDTFKSNLDYGVFLPIQKAAAAALLHGDSFCENSRSIYQKRRDALIDGLGSIGWNIEKPSGSMFIWAQIPDGWTSTDFAYALIDRAGVVVIPGQAFGPSGEGYVRIALVESEEVMKQVVDRIEKSNILKKVMV